MSTSIGHSFHMPHVPVWMLFLMAWAAASACAWLITSVWEVNIPRVQVSDSSVWQVIGNAMREIARTLMDVLRSLMWPHM